MLNLAVFLPIVTGLLLLAARPKSRAVREVLVEGVTVVTSLIVLGCLVFRSAEPTIAFHLLDNLPIAFMIDGVGSVFTAIVAFLWPLATLYGFEYMEHEGGENHFFALYTITYGVTLGISTAANLMTMYLFYEFLTVSTISLVMHGTGKKSVEAGHQYMMYSFFGAALAFIGVMLVTVYGNGGMFAMGGVLGEAFAAEHPLMLQLGYLCAFLGFGVKAAIFPMHAWLPSASVAPTPVTALLHAVAVVKAGVFGIIRVTYFSFGAQLLRGTHAQSAAILLASITIVYGSTMAVKEHHFKRRLAYSTISNLSYIVLAASLMTTDGLVAGLSHMLFHALIKITLFFCAGAVLVKTERTQVESLRGLYRVMPFTCAVYTVGALALMGTPLLPGFVSKWLIGSAVFASRSEMIGGLPVAWIGLFAILISAVLTAIYLMSVSFAMYFRPLEEDESVRAGRSCDPTWRMKLPFAVLTAAIVLCGLFSNDVVTWLTTAVAGVM
ncbi:MAG: proton-conducting transporter membrane subunit [Clostridia bacterium]|nr:proton-conducting transporter membrane subunit [Clostridia bacterium]